MRSKPLLITLITFVSWLVQGADPLDSWHVQKGQPELRGIAEGPPGLIATGFEGRIVTSKDGGRTWKEQTSGTKLPIFAVTWAEKEYVAVGRAGFVATSPDGETWTTQPPLTTNSLLGVVFANGNVAVAGRGGTILTSSNRVDWQRHDIVEQPHLLSIAYGNGTWVAVGESGAIYYSPDLNAWKRVTPLSNRLLGVRFLNGHFLAVGDDGWVLVSTDGVVWQAKPRPGTMDFWDADYAGGQYWLFSQFSSAVWQSADLSTWTNTPLQTMLTKCAVSGNRVLAVGPSGCIRASANGKDWGTLLSGPFGPVSSFGYLNGEYVAWTTEPWPGGSIVSTYPNARLHSTNGLEWTLVPDNLPIYTGMTSGGGTHVRVGRSGLIETSLDSVKWTRRESGTSGILTDIAYGNGRFVVVGTEFQYPVEVGFTLTSQDGAKWEKVNLGADSLVEQVVHGNGVFVAQSENTRWISTNGLNWVPGPSPGIIGNSRLAYGNGLFVSLPGSSTSQDGLTWRPGVGNFGFGAAIAFGAGQFVVVDGRWIASSPDGVHWTYRSSPGTNWLASVAFVNDRFIAGSGNGAIVTSSPLPLKAPELLKSPHNPIIGAGGAASLSAAVSLSEPASYQWLKDGQVISGATNATLKFNSSRATDEGIYQLVVSNAVGALTTPPVTYDVLGTMPSDVWTVRNQPEALPDIHRLAFILGNYVAVTLKGDFATSTNGVNWMRRSWPAGRLMRHVATIDNYCVAVGDMGRGFFSTNGLNWTAFAVPTTTTAPTLRGICRGKGLWVVVGDRGAIFTSPDLVKWTARTSNYSQTLNSVTSGHDPFFAAPTDSFFAVGERGIVLYSFEGVNWSMTQSPTTSDLNAVAYGDRVFLVGGKHGAFFSGRGGSWGTRTGGDFECHEIVYNTNYWAFVAVGNGVPPKNNSFSNDPITSYGGQIPYAGLSNTGDGVVTSIGGLLFKQTGFNGPWNPVDPQPLPSLRGVAGGPGFVIAIGNQGNVMVLNPGSTEPPRRLIIAHTDLLATAWGAGRAVIVGDGSAVITTTDTIKWDRVSSGTSKKLVSVCFGNGRFVAAGENGALAVSTNGLDWETRTNLEASSFQSVKYANGRYWITGSLPRVLVSEDTINWTTNAAPLTTGNLAGFDMGNGVRVALNGPNALFSHDGVNWQTAPGMSAAEPQTSLAFGGETFVAAGEYGNLRLSANGEDWYPRAIPTPWRILNVAVVNDRFYAVGEYGTILESAPFGRTEMRSGDPAELVVHGTPGRAYRVEFRNDLQPGGSWQTLTNITLSTNTATWRDTGDSNRPSRFFRVQSAP